MGLPCGACLRNVKMADKEEIYGGKDIEGNQPVVEMLRGFAEKKNATPAQISLAWMLHKYPNVVPNSLKVYGHRGLGGF